MGSIADPHVAQSDPIHQPRAESGVDLVAPTERLERGEAFRDEALPGLRRVASAEHVDQPAFCRLSGGHAHLHQPVLADSLLRRGFGWAVAPDEQSVPPGRVDPDELAVIIERDDCAVVVEFEQQSVDRLHPSELVGAGEAGEPQHRHHWAVYDDLLADRGGFDAAPGRRRGRWG